MIEKSIDEILEDLRDSLLNYRKDKIAEHQLKSTNQHKTKCPQCNSHEVTGSLSKTKPRNKWSFCKCCLWHKPRIITEFYLSVVRDMRDMMDRTRDGEES